MLGKGIYLQTKTHLDFFWRKKKRKWELAQLISTETLITSLWWSRDKREREKCGHPHGISNAVAEEAIIWRVTISTKLGKIIKLVFENQIEIVRLKYKKEIVKVSSAKAVRICAKLTEDNPGQIIQDIHGEQHGFLEL